MTRVLSAPAEWQRTLRFAAEAKASRNPFTYKYERTPGPDFADKRLRYDPQLGVYSREPSHPQAEQRPRRTYIMRSDAVGPYFTIRDRATGVPIVTLRGNRKWVEHEVMRYAHRLHTTSKDFAVLPCTVTDHEGGWAAADHHASIAYVSP